MKRIFLFVLFIALFVAALAAQDVAAELTFDFKRLSGTATNQYAVWIEDSRGQHIKTLYATRFTAAGGHARRDSSIPLWVKQSGVSGMSKQQVDALTGATPRAGIQIYTWNGTDSRGAAVPKGDYTIYLEGTLRWANQVLYSAPIRIGQGAASPEVAVKYTGDAGADREMISGVKVRVMR